MVAWIALASLLLLSLTQAKEDRAYGHHGKPAEYIVTQEGIVHPWEDKALVEAKKGIVHAWEDGVEIRKGIVHAWGGERDIGNKIALSPPKPIWIDDSSPLDDIIRLGLEVQKPKASLVDEADEDGLALLEIMESSSELCPLCHLEGHNLGHPEHIKFLVALCKIAPKPSNGKRKLESVDPEIMKTCQVCQLEGHTLNHRNHKGNKLDVCPLCLAEGHNINHELHKEIFLVANDFEWEIPGYLKETGEEKQDVAKDGCLLCQHEGTLLNHQRHLLLAQSLLKKENLDAKLNSAKKEVSMADVHETEEIHRLLSSLIRDVNHHQDMMLAKIAQLHLEEEKKTRDNKDRSLLEKIFGRQDDEEIESMMDLLSQPELEDFLVEAQIWEPSMAKANRANPTRNFHLDSDDENTDNTSRSLLDRILSNLGDLLGDKSEGDLSEIARQFALILLVFVGFFLATFGLIEFISATFGGDDINSKNFYQRLDDDEELMLELEAGRKGAITI